MGTIIKNPIIWSDIPDIDVLRYGDTFYMVSTTMHVLPGCPIMKSKDLLHWEIQSYIFDCVDDNDMYRLENREKNGVYGRGQWATSLRHHDGIFYACFACNEMQKTYIYYTDDIESGKWDRHVLDGIYHDSSLLFDDGKVYIFYNGGDVRITELKSDVSGVKEGGIDQLLLSTPKENIGLRCEGCHAYKIGEYYYLIFIEWPTDGHERRRQICYRSKELLGPYERKVILDDDMGYHNKGVAQGAIFDDEAGNWYAMLFQDHDAVGRIPFILPVQWKDEWPMIGFDGKVPKEWEVPLEETQSYDMVISDDFNHSKNVLANNWQWNHAPMDECWSFTKRPGYLRLTTGCIRDNVLFARNTLTQRTEGPACQATVTAELSGMKDGDYCGLIALQSNYGTVGIKMENGQKYVIMTTKDGQQYSKLYEGDCCQFRIHFDFEDSRDIATFFYSKDGVEFEKIGIDLKMLYALEHFMGYRIGIFNYASKEIGGYVDYQNFIYEK